MQAHENTNTGKRFLISIGVTFAILIAEVIGGYWTGSLALLSDAAHVFMDVFALILSYLALRLSALPADDRHTYGFHRLEVIAALINGVTLGAIAIEIFTESWARWQNPQPIKSTEMMIIAVIGLVANLIVVFILGGHDHDHEEGESEAEHEREDINVRSAFLHVVGDAVSSVGVIIAAGTHLVHWLDLGGPTDERADRSHYRAEFMARAQEFIAHFGRRRARRTLC